MDGLKSSRLFYWNLMINSLSLVDAIPKQYFHVQWALTPRRRLTTGSRLLAWAGTSWRMVVVVVAFGYCEIKLTWQLVLDPINGTIAAWLEVYCPGAACCTVHISFCANFTLVIYNALRGLVTKQYLFSPLCSCSYFSDIAEHFLARKLSRLYARFYYLQTVVSIAAFEVLVDYC